MAPWRLELLSELGHLDLIFQPWNFQSKRPTGAAQVGAHGCALQRSGRCRATLVPLTCSMYSNW